MKKKILRIIKKDNMNTLLDFLTAELITIGLSILETMFLVMALGYYVQGSQLGLIENFLSYIFVTVMHVHLVLAIKK